MVINNQQLKQHPNFTSSNEKISEKEAKILKPVIYDWCRWDLGHANMPCKTNKQDQSLNASLTNRKFYQIKGTFN